MEDVTCRLITCGAFLLQHWRVEVEELGKMVVKSQEKTHFPAAARAHHAASTRLKEKWLHGLMARQSFRAQTGRTPHGYTPSMCSVTSRLSDVSGRDALPNFASPSLFPVDVSTRSAVRLRGDSIKDWLDSSLQSALTDAPLHAGELLEHAAYQGEGQGSHSLASSAHLTSSSTSHGANAEAAAGSANAEACDKPSQSDVRTNSGLTLSGPVIASCAARLNSKTATLGSTSSDTDAGQTGAASSYSQAQQLDAALLDDPPEPAHRWAQTVAHDTQAAGEHAAGEHESVRGGDAHTRSGQSSDMLVSERDFAHQGQAHASDGQSSADGNKPRQGWSWNKLINLSSRRPLAARSETKSPPATGLAGKSQASSTEGGGETQAESRIPDEPQPTFQGVTADDTLPPETCGDMEAGTDNGSTDQKPAVPLATSPAGEQRGRWEWLKSKVGLGARKRSEGQHAGDGAARPAEECKVQQVEKQHHEQANEMERKDVVHETTSVGKSTLSVSSGLLSSMSTSRTPAAPAQAPVQVPGAATDGQATATPAGGLSAPAAGSQDAAVDKSEDAHGVKAHGSKRERLKDTLQRSLDSLNSLGSSLFKPLGAADQDREESLEQEAAHRVRSLPCATRLAAFKATEARGAKWPELSWRKRLAACVAADKSSAHPTGLRRINSQSSYMSTLPYMSTTGLVDPDALPRLRERHKASFLLLPPSPAVDERTSDTVALASSIAIICKCTPCVQACGGGMRALVK